MIEHANPRLSSFSWQRLWPGGVIGRRAIMTAGSLWALLHIFLFMAAGAVGVSSFKTFLVLVGVASVAGFADLKRNGESIFLENLGVTPFVVPAIWVGVIAFLELSISILVP
ncbi:MAG: hypothetical protein ABI556_12790 [Gemmatimonadales bacterium]